METTLSKWGNSKAVRVPVEACDELGLSLGDRAEVTVDAEHEERAYARTRRMTMEEFAAGWDGGKVGAEWSGRDVGTEVVA